MYINCDKRHPTAADWTSSTLTVSDATVKVSQVGRHLISSTWHVIATPVKSAEATTTDKAHPVKVVRIRSVYQYHRLHISHVHCLATPEASGHQTNAPSIATRLYAVKHTN